MHIHGIGNDNRKLVLKLLHKLKKIRADQKDLHILVGYGQHKSDNTRITANRTNFVDPFISEFQQQGLNAAVAPTEPINVDQWYCGNDEKRLNQQLFETKDKIQSLQLELKRYGLRDYLENIEKTAEIFEDVIKATFDLESWDEVQDMALAVVQEPDLDEVYNTLIAIFFKGLENTMLEAGWYLIKTFYNEDIETAMNDKKKKSLNSISQHITKLHEENSDAPRKSWIYNAVNLVIEHETIKAHSEKLFHTYGKIPRSHKVLLFPINLDKKKELIEYVDKHHPTVVEFRNEIARSKPEQIQKRQRKISLIKIIHKPEVLFSNEMSQFLKPGSLQKLTPPDIEKLQSRANENISKIQERIEKEKTYVNCYQELIESLEKVSSENSKSGVPDKKGKILD